MTRSELIASLSQRFPQLVLKDAELSVAEILGALGSAISRGGRVEIRGFGSFSLNYRPPRIGRNPRTGEQVNIPEKWAPHFKPGKELRELVNAA
ncbi:integration host factor subunit beta [Ferribacterium limneticum]|uniref:integration host factor subunit beta n=1 Tax=Ferribacterium limneticum TaxID=76259 RepID=UPI001CF831FD|nr:integration host factor subunit beta [Ferribacterium limneticum]UCV21494.1 integration host factor subunit beta [Ferribacterium limneticum]UCV23015.1 integration host factor subunit beta [Ferribacterium limneticum]